MATDIKKLAKKVQACERRALAQAITLVESKADSDRSAAKELLSLIKPAPKESIRIAISGAPGVGKSTLIDVLGGHCVDLGYKIAVLAVDPSSTITGGSILGDKTRMDDLSKRDEAFIRPSPAGDTLGGTTHATREGILICEAAGFDVIFVETVGVGQSETVASKLTDMFILLLDPGAGDELQGIKRGIVELADLVLVNKADGELADAAGRVASQYKAALNLLHPRTENWKVAVKPCSAIEGKNISGIWEIVEQFRDKFSKTGQIQARRAEQHPIELDAMLGKLNHVAIVVPDLEVATAVYRDTLGANVSEPQDLPEHGVTIVFVNLPNTKIELMHPLGKDSPVQKFLDKNPKGGIHHLCFEVQDIEEAREHLVEQGTRILGDGKPSIGAHEKPVLFLHPADCGGTLIELEQA